jgi:predicted nucleic acid-binding protein
MIIIVDANILISGIINPYGSIPELLLLQSPQIDFIVPEYAIEEINLHKIRVCKETRTTVPLFEQSLDTILSNVLRFSSDAISHTDIAKAEEITISIDSKDVWYIAFAIAFDAILWTGDLKLYKGLRRKGFYNIITTTELKRIIKGL